MSLHKPSSTALPEVSAAADEPATGELLGAVVERLLKALREARPETGQQFFRWREVRALWATAEARRKRTPSV